MKRESSSIISPSDPYILHSEKVTGDHVVCQIEIAITEISLQAGSQTERRRDIGVQQ